MATSIQILHSIRLQGPWEVLPPGETDAAAWQTVQLPASWTDLFGAVAGVASFRRGFNTPTGLESADKLWLRLPPDCGEVLSVNVNQQACESVTNELSCWEISPAVSRFNTVEIQIRVSEPMSRTSGLWRPVLLQIVRESNGKP